MTPEARKMKLFSLALLVGGLLGLVNVGVLVIGDGPSLDSALLLLASMISLLTGGYAAKEANVPNRAVAAYPMIFGSCVVLAAIVVGQLVLKPSVTLQFIELFALLAMASAIARGSHKVKKSLEAK